MALVNGGILHYMEQEEILKKISSKIADQILK